MLSNKLEEGPMLYDYLGGVHAELPDIPFQTFSRETYRKGDSRIISLVLSKQLRLDYAASSPACSVNFIKLNRGDTFRTYEKGFLVVLM